MHRTSPLKCFRAVIGVQSRVKARRLSFQRHHLSHEHYPIGPGPGARLIVNAIIQANCCRFYRTVTPSRFDSFLMQGRVPAQAEALLSASAPCYQSDQKENPVADPVHTKP